MTELIEYKVRPVTRYVVTKFERNGDMQGSSQCGTFDTYDTAYAVGYALAKADHEKMGWPVDDMRIQYPQHESVPYTED